MSGLAACLDAKITSAWSAANYYRTELLVGVGQSFAFIGLVSTLILQATFSGGMSKPQRILTGDRMPLNIFATTSTMAERPGSGSAIPLPNRTPAKRHCL